MRRIVTLPVMLAGLPGCAGYPGSNADAPIDTTIAAVRAAGPKYDGEYVRVRGLLDECGYFRCTLLPISPNGKPDWEARRLRFNFSIDLPTLNISQPVMPDRARMALNFLYRFSEVTLVGQYDYTCDSAQDLINKPGAGLQEITFCTEGGADLRHVVVATVHRRWPSTEFSAGEDGHRLIPLSADMVKLMGAAYRASGGIKPWDNKDPYRGFADTFGDGSAHFCVCLEDDCTGRWPTEAWHLPGNPTNPYTCVYATRTEGAWHFQPSFDR